MLRISDFKLAEAFIKKACKLKECGFLNLPVIFTESNNFLYNDGNIVVGKPASIGETITRIIMVYLSNFRFISDNHSGVFLNKEHQLAVHVAIVNFFRFLSFSQNSYLKPKSDKPVVLRLYQKPFIWVLMKDLICPYFNSYPVKNTKIIEISDPQIDICTTMINNAGEHIVFINNGIEYEPFIDACLLFEIIKAQGIDPKDAISKIMESQLKDTFVNSMELAYRLSFDKNNNISDFISALLTISGYENISEELIDQIAKRDAADIKLNKTAQGVNSALNISDTWWFLGLIEKMLEPARGPDWDTYKKLHPYFEELWNKIEKERKKRGRNGLTYEALLRIKDGELNDENVAIMEKTLSSDRVW